MTNALQEWTFVCHYWLSTIAGADCVFWRDRNKMARPKASSRFRGTQTLTFHDNEVVETNNYDDFERIQEIPISELHQRCHGNRRHAQDICMFTASYGDTHPPLRLRLYNPVNKNPSAWNFLSPKPEVTCVTVAIIIRVVLLSPYLRIRAVSLSSIHYNQSHRVYINRRRQYICLIWN